MADPDTSRSDPAPSDVPLPDVPLPDLPLSDPALSDPARRDVYRAAGLWDPDGEGARSGEGRLRLLDSLVERGATLERLSATDDADLIGLGFDLVVESGTMSVTELTGRAGVPPEELVELYASLGVTIEDRDARVFEDAEVEFVRLVLDVVGAFPEGVGEEVLRAIDHALATMAAAAISAFVGTVEDDLAAAGDELEWSRVVTSIGEVGLDIAASLRPLFRHHLRVAIGHQRASMRSVERRPLSELSVGFVDLVGYTSTSAEMDVGELVEFTSTFRSRAHEVAHAHGGRVVKHIGDEIMFSALQAPVACRIALALVASFGEEGSRPRGGVAHGRVLARHGDLYGPLVNLASRLADAAVPGEVLAPADIAGHAGDDAGVRLVPAGRRQLKGFPDPVSVVSVEQA